MSQQNVDDKGKKPSEKVIRREEMGVKSVLPLIPRAGKCALELILVPPFPRQPQALNLHSPGLAIFSCKGQSLEELQPSIRALCGIPAVQRDSGLREVCCWPWSSLPNKSFQPRNKSPKLWFAMEMLTNPSLTPYRGQHWEQDCGGTH